MQTPHILLLLLAFISSIHALAIPDVLTSANPAHLFKRKGGGGGGGRGGSSSGSTSSGSSSGGSRGSSSSTSNTGSTSGSRGGVAGVGPQPARYGGGAYYGGGASRPYPAGSRSPGGISPAFLPVAGLGFLGVAGLYAYGAYYYPYGGYYHYYNQSAGRNETHPASCYCGRYDTSCGCDSNNNTDYVNSIANNASIARLADVNGTDTLVINGTLPNGTTVEEAGSTSNAAAALKAGQYGGWTLIAGAVGFGVWML